MSRDAILEFNQCAKFELDTTYRSRVRTTTIFQLKVPIVTFLGAYGGPILLPWRKRRVGMCPKMRPVAVTKKGKKKDRNFHASNWLFAQTTHVDVGP